MPQQKYDPKIIIDLETLTGAIIVDLGHEYAGMFPISSDRALRFGACLRRIRRRRINSSLSFFR